MHLPALLFDDYPDMLVSECPGSAFLAARRCAGNAGALITSLIAKTLQIRHRGLAPQGRFQAWAGG